MLPIFEPITLRTSRALLNCPESFELCPFAMIYDDLYPTRVVEEYSPPPNEDRSIKLGGSSFNLNQLRSFCLDHWCISEGTPASWVAPEYSPCEANARQTSIFKVHAEAKIC